MWYNNSLKRQTVSVLLVNAEQIMIFIEANFNTYMTKKWSTSLLPTSFIHSINKYINKAADVGSGIYPTALNRGVPHVIMTKQWNFIANALGSKSHPTKWSLDKDPNHIFHIVHTAFWLQF